MEKAINNMMYLESPSFIIKILTANDNNLSIIRSNRISSHKSHRIAQLVEHEEKITYLTIRY